MKKNDKFFVAYSLEKPNLPIGVYESYTDMVRENGEPGLGTYKVGTFFKEERPDPLPIVMRAMSIRIARGLDLRTAAAEIGVGYNTLRNWEKGDFAPDKKRGIPKLTTWIEKYKAFGGAGI